MWTNLKNSRSQSFIISVCIILAVGAIWLFTALTSALNHIMPGSSISASTSMKPYELDFVTRIRNNVVSPQNVPLLHWKLSVPRAFLIAMSGKNGVPNGGPEARNSFWADMHAVISPDSLELSPAVLEANNKPLRRFVAINIYNESAASHIRGFDACVTDDDYKKVAEAHGAKDEYDKRCLPQENRCNIYSHLDGWNVQMTVTRDLYFNPESVCSVVKTFLNAHTVHRDDLR